MAVEVASVGGAANLQSRSILPSSLPYTVSPQAGYDGMSSVTFEKDSNLISSNIKSGVSIYGVNGSLSVPKVEARVRNNTGSMNTISFTVEHPEYFTNGNAYLQVINPYTFQDNNPVIITCSWENLESTNACYYVYQDGTYRFYRQESGPKITVSGNTVTITFVGSSAANAVFMGSYLLTVIAQ